MDIKPIETRYNGYRFRSRTEARWAVFLDALGIKYEYEREGFELGEAGRYLPDFYLPDYFGSPMWLEIKPDNKSWPVFSVFPTHDMPNVVVAATLDPFGYYEVGEAFKDRDALLIWLDDELPSLMDGHKSTVEKIYDWVKFAYAIQAHREAQKPPVFVGIKANGFKHFHDQLTLSWIVKEAFGVEPVQHENWEEMLQAVCPLLSESEAKCYALAQQTKQPVALLSGQPKLNSYTSFMFSDGKAYESGLFYPIDGLTHYNTEMIKQACAAAMQARFEFGETPKPPTP